MISSTPGGGGEGGGDRNLMPLFVVAGSDLCFYLIYLPFGLCGLKELVKTLTQWPKLTDNYFFKEILLSMHKKVVPNQISCS